MSRNYYPAQHKVFQYYLRFEGTMYEIEIPDNWKSAKKEVARSKQYHGVFITLSDDVVFSGRAASMINTWYIENGVIANIDIIEYEKDDFTDEWAIIFYGELDLSTYKNKDNVVLLKINSDVLTKKFQSRYQTEITINNDTTLDGKAHGKGDIETFQTTMRGRFIEGSSILDIDTPYKISEDSKESGNTGNQSYNVLLTKKNEGFFGDLPATIPINVEVTPQGQPGTLDQNVFYFNQQDIDVTIDLEIDFSATIDMNDQHGGTKYFYLELRVLQFRPAFDGDGWATFGGGQVITLIDNVELYEDEVYNIDWKGKVTNAMGLQPIKPNQGLWLVMWTDLNYPELTPAPDQTYWHWTINRGSVQIKGPSYGLPTQNPAITPYNMFQRMITMMGGETLMSNYLTNSRLSLANGYMIRNVADWKDTLVYTFEKLYHSYDTITPIGLSISRGNVIIEERDYFYQNFLAYDFSDEINNIAIEFDKEQAYSEINLGFETSNFSAEAAKKEFNVKTVWVSPINSYKKELNHVSNIQASPNVIETSRRIQYEKDVDRTYTRRGDTTMFFLDLKDQINEPRDWFDDFEAIPTSIPFPEDQFNIRLSPMNRLKVNSAWINFGYTEFKDRSLTFSSSTGATDMVTTPIGGVPNAENDNFVISDLPPAMYQARTITFEIRNDINFLKILNEKTSGVENMYGLFRVFWNNIVVTGYLKSYKSESNEIELQVKTMSAIDSEPFTPGSPVVLIPTGINLEEIL